MLLIIITFTNDIYMLVIYGVTGVTTDQARA